MGDEVIDKYFIGETEITRIQIGDEVIFESAPPKR